MNEFVFLLLPRDISNEFECCSWRSNESERELKKTKGQTQKLSFLLLKTDRNAAAFSTLLELVLN